MSREAAEQDSWCPGESCSVEAAEEEAALCPESRAVGSKVGLITVKALLTATALRRLDASAYRFCPDPGCDVVYFDRATGSVFCKRDLRTRVGLKEREDPVPICYCFDVTLADLRQEITTRGRTDTPARISAEVRSGHCACEVRNPQGTCCLGNVTRAVRAIESETLHRCDLSGLAARADAINVTGATDSSDQASVARRRESP